MTKSRRPHDEEKTEKYDPIGILKAALASAGTSDEAHLGVYTIGVYWIRHTLEALGGPRADN